MLHQLARSAAAVYNHSIGAASCIAGLQNLCSAAAAAADTVDCVVIGAGGFVCGNRGRWGGGDDSVGRLRRWHS